MKKRLYRVREGKIIAGVCTGFSEYFNIDVVIIRLLFIVLAFFDGFGILLYLICWFVMPRKEKVMEVNESINTEVNEKEKRKDINIIIGLIFIAGGILLFINYYFNLFKFLRFWPLILIFFGIYLILKGVKNEER